MCNPKLTLFKERHSDDMTTLFIGCILLSIPLNCPTNKKSDPSTIKSVEGSLFRRSYLIALWPNVERCHINV